MSLQFAKSECVQHLAFIATTCCNSMSLMIRREIILLRDSKMWQADQELDQADLHRGGQDKYWWLLACTAKLCFLCYGNRRLNWTKNWFLISLWKLKFTIHFYLKHFIILYYMLLLGALDMSLQTYHLILRQIHVSKNFIIQNSKVLKKKNPLFLVFWIFHIFSLSQSKCILVLKESAGSLLFQNVGVHGVLPY